MYVFECVVFKCESMCERLHVHRDLFVRCSEFFEALAFSRLQLYVNNFVTIFMSCLHKIINIQVCKEGHVPMSSVRPGTVEVVLDTSEK